VNLPNRLSIFSGFFRKMGEIDLRNLRSDQATGSAVKLTTNANQEIEALRAYAIIITVVAHLVDLLPQYIEPLVFFWLGGGVDLFFCISGFVITSSLLREKDKYFPDQSTHALRDVIKRFLPFWTRRVFRLWPAAIFWSFFVILCSLFLNNSGAFGTIRDNLTMAVATWLQVANFNLISSEYFHFSEAGISALRVCWSLSLEEQFYVIFPITLFFLGKRKVAYISFLLIFAQVFLIRQWPSPLWFLRTDAIAFGILIALFQRESIVDFSLFQLKPPKVLRSILNICLCALLVLVAKIDVVWFYHGLVALVSAMLVFVASFNTGCFMKEGILRRVLAFIGSRSYSIYLTHLVSFYLTKEIYFRILNGQNVPGGHKWELIMILTSLVLIATLSEFSYRFVETPLRQRGREISKRLHQSFFP